MTQHAAPLQTTEDEIDLIQLFGTLWRGKVWILLAAFLAMLLGGYYAFFWATPMYTASATVVQEVDQEPMIDFSSGLGGGGLGSDQTAINTELQILKSRALMLDLIEKLDLLNDPDINANLHPKVFSLGTLIEMVRGPSSEPTQEQVLNSVLKSLGEMISVSNIRQSYVFTLTATTRSAEKSALLVNTLAELYILNQLDVKNESNVMATAWLTEKASELRLELEAAEAAVKDFNASTDLINADTLAALNRQVKALRERFAAAQVQEAQLRETIALYKAALRSETPETLLEGHDDSRLQALLGDLETNPQESRAALNSYLQQLLSQEIPNLNRVAGQVLSLERSIREQEAQTAAQSADLITLQQLEREAEASALLYEFFLNRLKETSVQSGVQRPDARILSEAAKPLRPSAPRKSMILALSMILGLMAGAGFVLIREMRTSTFRAAEELEAKTQHAVLGQIPVIPGKKRSKLLQYLIDKPTSIAAEAVRNMRTSVLLSDANSPPQVIMSTSSVPGEGKTTQSLALAQNLAGLGKSVLLIEGDVRKRIFKEYFDIRNGNGLMSVLEGRKTLKEAVERQERLRADVLMSEAPSANAADIFSSQAFADLIKEARKAYDYIVIDTPPVLAVPDARIIGRNADTTLYTVRWDHTKQREVAQGLKELSQVNVKIAGLVLSQIDQHGLERYGYGKQASTYAGYHDN